MILSDIDIKERVNNGELIKKYDSTRIGPSSYELRMSNVYIDLTEGNKRIELKFNQEVIIKPGHRVVLLTEEELNLPNDIMARVISKGSLFSIGLTPICTNADPGFMGQLGLVVQNISDKYIVFPQREPLAKIDFSLLTQKCSQTYNGQHGYGTKVWPIKEQLQKNYSEVEKDQRVDSEIEEANRIIPTSTANAISRLLKYQKRTNIYMILLMITNVVVMAATTKQWLDITTSFFISVVASLFVILLSNIIDGGPKNGH